MSIFIMIRRKLLKLFWMGAQKFMGAQKLLRGHDASASLRHPQMAHGERLFQPHLVARAAYWQRRSPGYNWRNARFLGWPFPMLNYKYTEAILSNSTRQLLWFEITKMLTAV